MKNKNKNRILTIKKISQKKNFILIKKKLVS